MTFVKVYGLRRHFINKDCPLEFANINRNASTIGACHNLDMSSSFDRGLHYDKGHMCWCPAVADGSEKPM
jgi:hypothetical protein